MDHNSLTIKTYMAIMAERDAAIRERNLALEERKRAFAERDMAMLQRDAAIAERNSAMQERDEAISALRLRENVMNEMNMMHDSPETRFAGGAKHIHQQQAHHIDIQDMYNPKENTNETFNMIEIPAQATKPKRGRRPKENKPTKTAKTVKLIKREAESLDAPVTSTSSSWNSDVYLHNDVEGPNREMEPWKGSLGLNQINFDESTMPVPVCSCTGTPQPCYKWGNGGWQSACCTTNMSMYPLPQVSNKRYSRIGGRKMSGSAFSKLLNRLAAEGYDLSSPLDLKDHWAKHGTNRYSTLK